MRASPGLSMKDAESPPNALPTERALFDIERDFIRFWTVSAFRPGRRPGFTKATPGKPYPLQHWEATLTNTSINKFHFPRHRWHMRSQPSQRLQLTSSVIFSFSFHSFPLKLPFFYLINAIFKVIVVYAMLFIRFQRVGCRVGGRGFEGARAYPALCCNYL
jgi:hypothetical protein